MSAGPRPAVWLWRWRRRWPECLRRSRLPRHDPYTDYHEWNNDEVVYYNRWTVETRRDPHRDFRHLNKDEQKEYWTWRHNHGDRYHDRDHH
jgi:hypothetical protein